MHSLDAGYIFARDPGLSIMMSERIDPNDFLTGDSHAPGPLNVNLTHRMQKCEKQFTF